MPSKGGINEIKTQLMDYIEEADSTITCFGNWFEALDNIYGPKTGLKVPIVYVRISPVTIRHMTYSRSVPESGSMQTFEFTAHVFDKVCKEAGQEKYKYAHDIADKIMDYLEKINWNSGAYADSAIVDVQEMQARESEPKRGAKRLCRMIIEGTLFAKRQD